MKEITLKLRRECTKDFMKFAEQLYIEDVDKHDIIKTFDNYVKSKISNMYSAERNRIKPLSEIGFNFKVLDANSKAEVIFARILENNKIDYKFQYKIGPYRADFLVSNFLIVEIDGPVHKEPGQIEHDIRRDKYLRKMGYKILRVPIIILSLSEQAIIDEIKEIIEKSNGKTVPTKPA